MGLDCSATFAFRLLTASTQARSSRSLWKAIFIPLPRQFNFGISIAGFCN